MECGLPQGGSGAGALGWHGDHPVEAGGGYTDRSSFHTKVQQDKRYPSVLPNIMRMPGHRCFRTGCASRGVPGLPDSMDSH